MNLPKQCKPDSCVSKYPIPSIFGDTYVDVDGEGGGSVYASDKSCAVRVPLENVDPEDTSGPVSVEAWKMARKVSKFRVPGMILEPDQCRFVDGSTLQRPILGKHEAFPLKTVREIIDCSVDTQPAVCRVAIDVTLLKRIADGLGSTTVDLILHRPTADAGLRVTKSIGVIPVEGSVPDARGAIMPCNGAGVGK